MKTFKELRIEAGYDTQVSLAKKMEIHNMNIYRWENGTRSPSLETVQKLAEVLNVTEGEIIEAITKAREETT